MSEVQQDEQTVQSPDDSGDHGETHAGGGRRSAATSHSPSESEGLLADAELTRQCLAGHVIAWESLYDQCNDALLVSIEILLQPSRPNCELVDEIAARVWYALVDNDGQLLEKYDHRRGARLITFMRAVAKDMIRRHFRSEYRRAKRERISRCGKQPYHTDDRVGLNASINEFLDTLTVSERQYCHEVLLEGSATGDLASQRARLSRRVDRIGRRIHKKLLVFLGYRS